MVVLLVKVFETVLLMALSPFVVISVVSARIFQLFTDIMSDINIEDHDAESPLRVVLDSDDLGVERDMEHTRIRSRSASRGRSDSSSSCESSTIRESHHNFYPDSDWDVAYPTPSDLPAVPLAPFGGVQVFWYSPPSYNPSDSEDSDEGLYAAVPDRTYGTRVQARSATADDEVIYVRSRSPSLHDDAEDAPVQR